MVAVLTGVLNAANLADVVGVIVVAAVALFVLLPMVGVGSVPVLWAALILLVATLGELLVSPVGLSLSTRPAPRAFPVLMVALFYLSVALGTALSGAPAGYYSEQTGAACFGALGAGTIVVGAVLLVLSPWIRRTMRGVR